MSFTDLSTCRQTIEALPWYVNGSLDADERQRVENHLDECIACARERDLLESMQRHLPRSSAVHDGAAPFSELLQRINRQERRQRAWKMAAAFLALLAIVIAVAVPQRVFDPAYRAVTAPLDASHRVQLEVTLHEPGNVTALTELMEHYDADILATGDPVLLEFRVKEPARTAALLDALREEPSVRAVSVPDE